jgi:predicted nucleic acid-binding protein
LIVVDASLFTAWLLDEPGQDGRDAAWDIVSGDMMFVPVHWPNEVANALRRAVRTKRISADDIRPIAERVSAFKIEFAEPTQRDQIGDLAVEALEHSLSTYDMAYIRVAHDHQCALATVDGAMREAARRLRIPLLPE